MPVRVGIIGLGFMGVTHFRAYQRLRGVRIAAVCTRSEKKLRGDWRDVRGNFGPSGGVQDMTGIRTYREIEQILNDPDLDLIDICLPTDMHDEVAIAAMKAGKHVLVEKPIALTVERADRMLQVARETGRLLMVGQVLRFFPEFALIKRFLDSGEFGELLGLHLKRIITKPDWSADIANQEKTGGPAIDLHIHDSDFVQFLFGLPQRVVSTGIVNPGGFVDYLATEYLYDGVNRSVSAVSGALSMPGRPFCHGYEAYFEKATFTYDSAYSPQVTWLTAEGKVRKAPVPKKDAFVAELGHVVECVRRNTPSPILSAESARNSLALCYLEVESVKRGEPVAVQVV